MSGRGIARVALLGALAMLTGALAGCGSSHPSGGEASNPAASITTADSTSSSSQSGSSQPASTSSSAQPAGSVPRFDHVVVVVEENHSYGDIIGSSAAPYLNSLAAGGALFTQSFAITHPSEPNYLALFSGSTQGLSDDSCPHTFAGANLGSQLIGAGLSFAGYSESMPLDGDTGCGSDGYARKHNPWSDFANLPATVNRTLSSFPADYAALPTVSFVIPNLSDDMHDGSVATGDSWLRTHLDGYARWAMTHNSLLIVTWDEDDNSSDNHIATILFGASVRPGRYDERVTHYRVLRTVQAAYGLSGIEGSVAVAPIIDAWR